jgi:hypothetical protein
VRQQAISCRYCPVEINRSDNPGLQEGKVLERKDFGCQPTNATVPFEAGEGVSDV